MEGHSMPHRRHHLGHDHEHYGGQEPWNPRTARQLGGLLVFAGVVIFVLPFIWLEIEAGSGVPGYLDKSGTYHSALPIDPDQRREFQKEPPPGSLNRIFGPTSEGDWLLLCVLAVGALVGAVGLIQVASLRVRRGSKHGRRRTNHRHGHRPTDGPDHRHGVTQEKII
jgi:hypothetical protein